MAVNGESDRSTLDKALTHCAYQGDLNGVRDALRMGADPNASPEGVPALHGACIRGCPEMVDEFLKAGVNVDIRDDIGLTALMLLAVGPGTDSQHAAMDKLIGAGADLSIMHGESGGNAMDMATVLSHRGAVERLHAAGGKCSTHGLAAMAERIRNHERGPSR